MAVEIQTLRDEGVLEIGGLVGTSFVFVITRSRTYLFHAAELPKRRLDAYGAQLAAHWLEEGSPSWRVAADLGISEEELRRALLSAGFERTSPAERAHLARARGRRKLGNRRGRLVRVNCSAR